MFNKVSKTSFEVCVLAAFATMMRLLWWKMRSWQSTFQVLLSPYAVGFSNAERVHARNDVQTANASLTTNGGVNVTRGRVLAPDFVRCNGFYGVELQEIVCMEALEHMKSVWLPGFISLTDDKHRAEETSWGLPYVFADNAGEQLLSSITSIT